MIVALVYSGSLSERADDRDTLVQVDEIHSILRELGHEVRLLAFVDSLTDLEYQLKMQGPDFVFNLVEAAAGSDELLYTAAALFEFLDIPYSGCLAPSLALLGRKTRQKQLMSMCGLSTPAYLMAQEQLGPQIHDQTRLIVKSDTEHASLGMDGRSLVLGPDQARTLIEQKKAVYGGQWFAEVYIEGREFNVALLDSGNGIAQVLPMAEMTFQNFGATTPKIVDYAAKWDETSLGYASTVRVFVDQNDPLLDQLARISLQCWLLFDLRGAARVDFRIDEDGSPWILEINANPCLSSDAGFMAAATQAGLSGSDVVQRLIHCGVH